MLTDIVSFLQIRAEEVSQEQSMLELKFSAQGLDKKVLLYILNTCAVASILAYPFIQDFLGKSDPYLEFAKQNPDGSFSPVHRTEVSEPPPLPPSQMISLSLSSGDEEYSTPDLGEV